MKGLWKFIGYGIIIWATAFIVACVFVAFKYSGVLMNLITTLAMLIIVYLLAKNLSVSERVQMLKYSLTWAVTAFILDWLITASFTGKEFFMSWHIWLAYLLVILVPLLALKPKEKTV